MSPFQWSVVFYDLLPAVFGGLLIFVALRFSWGSRASRAWRSLLGVLGVLLINAALLAFALFSLVIWLALPGAEDSAYENPSTVVDYLVLAGICGGPLLVGVAFCMSAIKLARRPEQDPMKPLIEDF